MENIIFATFDDAVYNGVVPLIRKGGATAKEFDLKGLSKRIVKEVSSGYTIDQSVSFWVVAEDYAIYED